MLKWIFFICLSTLCAEPLRHMPLELYDAFTLGGQIPVVEAYSDSTYSPDNPLIYSAAQIQEGIEDANRRQIKYYSLTDNYLYAMLDKFPVAGKTVGIIGSVTPWYESIILSYGGIPITLDYNKIKCEDPRVMTMTVEEYSHNPIQFDFILSISSTEHDGLGRFGDPINPNGDIDSMQNFKTMLKDGGLLFLSVPTGQDFVFWNAHRMYGPIRFPLLIQGWDLVDSCGPFDGVYEPLFVLRPCQNMTKT